MFTNIIIKDDIGKLLTNYVKFLFNNILYKSYLSGFLLRNEESEDKENIPIKVLYLPFICK